MALRNALSERLKTFLFSASIIKTIKTSHILIIFLMLVPVMLSITAAFFNTLSYDRLITNVNKANRINQVVSTEVTTELWDIVAGNKSFDAGSQYLIIGGINSGLRDIMRTTAETENRQILEVAGRAMGTLDRYVGRLGAQMKNNYPVIENERMLDEIRGVAALVSDLLQSFIVREIESAAVESQKIKKRALIIGIGEFAVVFTAVYFSVLMQKSVAKSVDNSISSLVSFSSSIAEGNLDARVEVPKVQELQALTNDLNIMAYKIKTLIEENTREQRNLQKSEMRALQAQITPHFLYNTLDSIVWLAEGNKNEQVISITRAFSDFFRISLSRGNEWVRVQDEFKHIESYLTIQKIRYRDILDYSIEYEREMEQKIMLKLLLQPLVENALYHGIKNKRGRGSIAVKGWREKNFLCFSVADNGVGMTSDHLASVKAQLEVNQAQAAGGTENRIYGLYNVAKRLELYYNRTDLLDVQSVYREGTQVTLLIPGEESV
ncbi:MAG: sensor histidine kinase [Treponema sp.]|jgi:two-component system sensor histidine kinase YesM|nr:sensor histidine kinase [Treponema sp.]